MNDARGRGPDGGAGDGDATTAGRAVTRYWQDGGWLERDGERLWRNHADSIHAGLLRRWLPEEGRGRLSVLKTDLYEEAVGTGQAAWLAARFDLVVGIDLTPAVATRAAAERTETLRALVADTRHLPFADGSFDLVLSLSTLDHFAEAESISEALREVGRVLRPGGVLLLTLDNPANPVIKLRQALPFPLLRRLGVMPYYCGPSVHPKRLRAVAGAAGFDVAEMAGIMHCPRLVAVPFAKLLDRHGSEALGAAFLRALRSFEVLDRLPSRHVTAHFVAARCIRRA